MRVLEVAVVVVCVAVLAGCGDDDEAASATTTAPSKPTATSKPTAPSKPTATSKPSATTEPPVAWTDAELSPWAFPPAAAGDTWAVPGPSPDLPADETTALADGVYYAEIVDWSPDAPDSVTLRVFRFELCDAIAESADRFGCEFGWTATDVGVVHEEPVERGFELGPDLSVGLVASQCADGMPTGVRTFAGDGRALASLWTDLAQDYDTWVRPGLQADIDPFNLAYEIASDPDSPFTAVCELSDADYVDLVWTSPDGPQLMYGLLAAEHLSEEGGFAVRTPAELLRPVALEISAARPTLYLYQAFIS
jgi:hypothetical protein